jgi:hypothetical protein
VGLKLSKTHQLLVCGDEVNLLGDKKCRKEAVVYVPNEAFLEVSTEKRKYILISRHHNAGKSHNKQIANRPFQNVAKLIYLRMTLTRQNCIQ